MTTDNRTNELSKIRQDDAKHFAWSEAQVEAACVAYESTNAFGSERATRMRAALVAAASVASAVEQVSESDLAEVIAKANYDWSQQRLEFWRRPESVEAPGNLDQFISRAVLAALGGESR